MYIASFLDTIHNTQTEQTERGWEREREKERERETRAVWKRRNPSVTTLSEEKFVWNFLFFCLFSVGVSLVEREDHYRSILFVQQ
jgi:hypothetical protein